MPRTSYTLPMLLTIWLTASASATPPASKCVKDGETITVSGRVSISGGTDLKLAKPLCVQDRQIGNHVDSLTTVGNKLPADVEMSVTGKLHKSTVEIGFEIYIASAIDVNAEAKSAYKTEYGSDAFSSCLQWQREESVVVNQHSHGGDVSPVYKPHCGLRTVDAIVGTPIEEWMAEPGEGYVSAQKIVDAAVAQRPNPSEPFDECTEWQTLALDALTRNGYPAYPNATQRYISPRCGVRLSNNTTRERVYLWMPESLSPTTSDADNDKYRCVVKYSKEGQATYASTPCTESLSLTGAILQGVSLTSIKTIPAGAWLLMNGSVIAKTPAILVFQQPGSPLETFTLYVKKDGYEEGSLAVRDGDIVQVQLTRKGQ